ncbi:MAG: TIM barrel protein [Alphaproteobacteria bacterium]|nr:TIM barrel protein [Alphaproteobacteria bacterium]
MPRFAANISTMFTEHALIDRVQAAAAAGFEAVECQFPYEVPADEMKAAFDEAGVPLVLINTPPGDFAAGERGLAALPGREADFRVAIDLALDYAEAVGCRQIHVMAGVLPDGVSRDDGFLLFEQNLRHAVSAAEGRQIDALLIEPINTRDIPGYLLNRPEEARDLITRVGAANLRLQYDFYHTQIMRGDLAKGLEEFWPLIGHVQFAGVPERQEPDIGELNCHYLFDCLDRLGYAGWVGAEYVPAGRTEDGLSWASRYGIFQKPTHLA